MIFNWTSGSEQSNFGPSVFNWSVGDGGSAPVPPPSVEQTPAGSKRRRRERYIARFEGLDYDFETLEDLETFVSEAERKLTKKLPAKAKTKPKSIKVSITPEYREELAVFARSADIVLPTIDLTPAMEALKQVRILEERYRAWKKRLMQEDEEILLLYDF